MIKLEFKYENEYKINIKRICIKYKYEILPPPFLSRFGHALFGEMALVCMYKYEILVIPFCTHIPRLFLPYREGGQISKKKKTK